MMLDEDVELLEGLPIAHIKSINSIVVADMHLGYEGAMAGEGAFLPKVNLKEICREVKEGIARSGAERVIVDGDIKSEFSKVSVDELNELHGFASFLEKEGVMPVLVKGNHDNFVDRYRGAFRMEIYGGHAEIGEYLFLHGDKEPARIKRRTRMVVMGHEHPAITISTALGRREKVKCFLYGRYRGKGLLVLPAIGYFSTGMDVGAAGHGMLSPILRRGGIGSMHAIACAYGSTIDFGKVSDLRGKI
ncbi:MAG: metallophosphoesterase [Candidatus Marsarchaeota archaeon]|nr:metallophosphoesterase [Candidatus Marsarchaeota archaeon]